MNRFILALFWFVLAVETDSIQNAVQKTEAAVSLEATGSVEESHAEGTMQAVEKHGDVELEMSFSAKGSPRRRRRDRRRRRRRRFRRRRRRRRRRRTPSPTVAPTPMPTAAPTVPPTAAPTPAPTEAPTVKAGKGKGGSLLEEEDHDYAEDAADASCPCISQDKIDTDSDPRFPTYHEVKYPANVGTYCKAWDLTSDPACGGSPPPEWCENKWCYVDPCTCGTMAKKSSYFPKLKTTSKHPVYYSYTTCSSDDAFTCTSGDATARACPCHKDEGSCGSGENCVWNAGKCIGAELLGCNATEAPRAVTVSGSTPEECKAYFTMVDAHLKATNKLEGDELEGDPLLIFCNGQAYEMDPSAGVTVMSGLNGADAEASAKKVFDNQKIGLTMSAPLIATISQVLKTCTVPPQPAAIKIWFEGELEPDSLVRNMNEVTAAKYGLSVNWLKGMELASFF